MQAHAIRIVFAVVAAATVAHGSSHTAAQELTSLSTCVQLQDGVPITNLWAAQGQQRCFGITVPAGQRSLTVDMTQLTGNADLYVRFGSMPTDSVRRPGVPCTARCTMRRSYASIGSRVTACAVARTRSATRLATSRSWSSRRRR